MNILVAGGAGYIGSHTARELKKSGYNPIIFDNFSTGNRLFCHGFETVEGDIGDYDLLCRIFDQFDISAVINFASFIAVGESVVDPLKYYDNNFARTVTLLRAVKSAGVGMFVFSSSAAVYGMPQQIPITEDAAIAPINPYGRTKAMVEEMLRDLDAAHGLRSVMLRYFNAAGAHVSGDIGENHFPETHLVPLVMRSILDDSFTLKVFGTDYPTADGTCIRDYIHVTDLAAAHVLALKYLHRGGGTDVFNLGNGSGFSVYEIIDMVKRVTGKEPKYTTDERRPGDPSSLIASSERARTILGWKPEYGRLESIIETAWAWEEKERLPLTR